MKIAVEGCAHGELDKIYETIKYIEGSQKVKIDLLLCCGDFQAVRNQDDLVSMAVPAKYLEMKDFHEYYGGKKKAPLLTIFVGGNHEAATHLWQLPYGGWVAENIYYLGYAGVVTYAGLRIGGLSGIFKRHDYYKSHFECPPFSEDSKRSFYHSRSQDVAKLRLLAPGKLDVFLSHDWPKNIADYGNSEQLVRFKPFLKEEISQRTLGSDAGEELLKALKPRFWFSGHMHAKFSALVPHENGSVTKFLALDKCLPHRNFLQIVDVGPATDDPVLKYDREWITALRITNCDAATPARCSLASGSSDRCEVTQAHLEDTDRACGGLYDVVGFFPSLEPAHTPQTDQFCERYAVANVCKKTSIAGPRLLPYSGTLTPSHQRQGTLSEPTGSRERIFKSHSFPVIAKEHVDSDDEFGDLIKPGTMPVRSQLFGDESDSESSSSRDDDLDDGLSEAMLKSTAESHEPECDGKDALDGPVAEESQPLPSSVFSTPSSHGFSSYPKNESFSEESVGRKLMLPPPTVPEQQHRAGSDMSNGSGGAFSADLQFESACCDDRPGLTPSTPTPTKKMKLVRRNQSMYTPVADEE